MKNNQRRKRIGLVYALVCVVFFVLLVRLVQLQIVKADEYSAIVERQTTGQRPIQAERGILYDRNGKVIVNNVSLTSLFAQPANKEELRNSARYLEKVFHLKKGTAVKRFGLSVGKFRYIRRMMSDSLAERIMTDAPSGLYSEKEPKRVYPFGLSGKQILGYTDIDGKGLSGLELMFNKELAGKEGLISYQRDGQSQIYNVQPNPMLQPVPGQSMVLTIDWELQEIVEEELKAGVENYNAKAAIAVFLNSNNGEILAMAHYDPNEKNPDRPVKHRAVTDRFEPGSSFKALTMAGFLEDGLIEFDDSVYCEEGKIKLNGRFFHDDKELAWLKPREVFEYSSNIGMAKYALIQTGERMCEYLDRYGIGTKIGLEWPGETSGSLQRYKKWSDITLANLSIGHGVSVSALQLAAYISAVANGGILYKPQVILSHIDETGKPFGIVRPEVLTRVMSEETSDTLKSFMRGVVDHGTATEAKSDVITIAGKTGTAQIFDVERNRYSSSRYTANFAGFFPAEKPLVTGVVVYIEPRKVHYGGHTAGPVFRKIAERYAVMKADLFTVEDRVLVENSHKIDSTTIVPDFLGREYRDVQEIALENKVKIRSADTTGFVYWQFPPADRIVFAEDDVVVALKKHRDDKNRMANLKGLSIREVSAFLKEMGIKYKITGNGLVVKQSLKPGDVLSGNEICKIECKPI